MPKLAFVACRFRHLFGPSYDSLNICKSFKKINIFFFYWKSENHISFSLLSMFVQENFHLFVLRNNHTCSNNVVLPFQQILPNFDFEFSKNKLNSGVMIMIVTRAKILLNIYLGVVISGNAVKCKSYGTSFERVQSNVVSCCTQHSFKSVGVKCLTLIFVTR